MTAQTHAITELEVAKLIVDTLHLEAAPDDIIPDEPLFREGLGLDSIDALELALAISRSYGFDLKSDDERNTQIFASLRNLTRHIDAHRTK
jgi:acyl carrier protein